MYAKKSSLWQNIKGTIMFVFIFFTVPFFITLAIRMVGETEKIKPMIVTDKSWTLNYYVNERTCNRGGCRDLLHHLSSFNGTYPSKPLFCGNAQIESKIKEKHHIKSHDSCLSEIHLELLEPESNKKYLYEITEAQYFDESVYPIQSKLQVAHNNFGRILYVYAW